MEKEKMLAERETEAEKERKSRFDTEEKKRKVFKYVLHNNCIILIIYKSLTN